MIMLHVNYLEGELFHVAVVLHSEVVVGINENPARTYLDAPPACMPAFLR